jgi:hypothetical protein
MNMMMMINIIFSCMAQKPPVGQSVLIEASRSHSLKHTTVGRTPLDEGLARRRDFYLTIHNTHNRQTFMPPTGWIRTCNPNRRAAADPRLRPRGHLDRPLNITRMIKSRWMPVTCLRITPRMDRARKQWRDDGYVIDSILHEGTAGGRASSVEVPGGRVKGAV